MRKALTLTLALVVAFALAGTPALAKGPNGPNGDGDCDNPILNFFNWDWNWFWQGKHDIDNGGPGETPPNDGTMTRNKPEYNNTWRFKHRYETQKSADGELFRWRYNNGSLEF